jgi:hypothetical protein
LTFRSGCHLTGHRIDDISFSRREVTCECAVVLTVDDNEDTILRNEALAEAFRAHRRAMGPGQTEAAIPVVAPGRFMR